MAKLTMNTPGRKSPREADFVPPKRNTIPKWMMVGGGALFLVMFTGLVVTTTLLIAQTNRSGAVALGFPQEVEDPVASDLDNTVTRQEVSLLQSGDAVEAPGVADRVQIADPVVRPAVRMSKSIEVIAATPPKLGLGAEHRYRVASCIDYLDTLVKITTVRFPVGSDVPSQTDMIRARNIATALATCDEVKVIVEGHSDRRGNDDVNMRLSWFRAQSVIDQLQREGFDISAMQPRGFGATRPINLSGTISGEAINRRVQFALAPRKAPDPVRLSSN